MATANVVNMDGADLGSVELNDAIFDVAPNAVLVQEVIVALQSAQRQGTHKTKTRKEVSGGGIKPFRQKGTGNARRGSSREPVLRGGGTVWGPRPRSYRKNITTRARRQALSIVLSDRRRNEKLTVMKDFKVEAPKTKPLANMISLIAPEGRKTLLITADYDKNVILSTRNLPRVTVRTAADLSALDAIGAVRVVVQEEALAKLEERLS